MSGLRVGNLQRLLFPSIADLLFAGLVITRIQATLFHDGDTGWHLWAGSETLKKWPGTLADGLSFTRSGEPWDNVEWLGEVLMALLFQHGGYLGVAVLCSIVFAATFSWLYRILLRETGDPPAALLITALAAQVALIQFLARPLIFSFPLFLAVVECLRRSDIRRGVLFLVPVLTVLWANLHPSAYLAPAMALYFWIIRGRTRELGLVTLFSFIALGITPWGFGWVFAMVLENRSYFSQVEEWASPSFGELRFLPYLLYLLLSLAARRGARPLALGEAVWGLGWMVAALVSARLGPYAVIAWAPWLARDLTGSPWLRPTWLVGRLWQGAKSTLGPMEGALSPKIWPILFGAGMLILAPRLQSSFPDAAAGFPSDRFPRQALAAADSLGLGPRVFNRYAWGGFVSWESGARYRTFIDGRAGFFGAELLDEYLEAMTLGPLWRDVLIRHEPDWLLLAPDSPIVTALPADSEWRVVHRDEVAIILVARPSQ
jgi:hypothetical protein